MLGAGLQFGRGGGRGEDRFYNPAKARSRAYQNHRAEQLRRAQSDVSPSQAQSSSEPESREPPPARVAPCRSPAVEQSRATTMKGWRPSDVEISRPYFVLGDLWESFKEWSAYGAGVPLILNDADSVVQYYVPYLSGIQIYGDSSKFSVKPRRPDEDSDSDFRDSSSDGSSDCEPERRLKYMQEQPGHNNLLSDVCRRIDRLSLRDNPISLQEDFSSDEGESGNSQACLIFEYLERDPPYGREPLADKILDLAFRFPELKTLRSCDLLSPSWISVSWYPIYRIPTGPTLKDLDACFLTYHSLHTPMGGLQNAQAPVITRPCETDCVPKIPLHVFGLASYKFKGSLWTPNGGFERQLATSLLQAADNWLRLLQVSHPDFLFFSRQ
ncbi:hypothetical protein L484_016588 [Morus notabilis]|uniref:DUF789 domain-containing protein n=1 Tax=Morus notabilis TaxID=981085 RepID=W9R7F5_9ROSA|nr:hypothetical protein L484_016588 [Morus notabilis]